MKKSTKIIITIVIVYLALLLLTKCASVLSDKGSDQDAVQPETKITEETTTPETMVPETMVPETTVPETTVPETTVPAEVEDTVEQSETVIESESVEHRTGDDFVGISDKNIEDIDATYYENVRDDNTGKWSCIVIYENNMDITEYALSCYKKYMNSNKTLLAVINLATKTSTCISDMDSSRIDVAVYEYTDGEEHYASQMFTGTKLDEKWVYKDNGDIEKLE